MRKSSINKNPSRAIRSEPKGGRAARTSKGASAPAKGKTGPNGEALPHPHIIELGPIGATCLAFTRMIRRRGAWVREHIRKRMIAYALPVVAVIISASLIFRPVYEDHIGTQRIASLCSEVDMARFMLAQYGCTDLSDWCSLREATLTGTYQYSVALMFEDCGTDPFRMQQLIVDYIETYSPTEPLPQRGEKVIEVASYTEGTAP